MIVISKKKIQVIILCLMISILTVAITIGNDSKNTKMVNSENIEKIVILDPGHGIPDERCTK